MNRPQYNRCDACGRNPHKVAVRWPARIDQGYDGPRRVPMMVRGYCPSCYDERTQALVSARGATVLYDRRKRKVSR